jgi:hypothetical protein
MPSLSKTIVAVLCLVFALSFATPHAAADEFVLTYQGPNFTAFDGIDQCVASVGTCAITASVTLTNPLGDNFSGVVSPTAFSISDGLNVLTNGGLGVTPIEFFFVTNSSGTVTDWLVDVANPNVELFTGVNRFSIGTGNCSVAANDGTTGTSPSGIFGCAQTPASGPVGVWSTQTTATPEPSSVALTLAGIGLVFAMRKRWTSGLQQAS